ncbi:hypothetical protein GCM10027300_41280 [Modestobacter lapidis]
MFHELAGRRWQATERDRQPLTVLGMPLRHLCTYNRLSVAVSKSPLVAIEESPLMAEFSSPSWSPITKRSSR